jgi:pimeloyl-ACP methyl ester carboxylesterase
MRSQSLKLDTTIIPGDIRRPAVVFIHGLGMNKKIWECPDEARVLGGRYPLHSFLCKEPETCSGDLEHPKNPAMTGPKTNVTVHSGPFNCQGVLSFGRPPERLMTLFHDIKERGYTVIAWSQRRPSAEIAVAVSELTEVISMYREYCTAGIVLIGHSRGGLIARMYIARKHECVKGLFTLATPHRGSRMAQWANYLSPLATILTPLLPESEKGSIPFTIKKVIELFSSKAVKELLPDTPFFRSLKDEPLEGIYYHSLGGKDPTLLTIYRKVSGFQRDGERISRIVRHQKVVSFPGILENVIPAGLLPEEMKNGKGDGLVSAESSRLPWAHGHDDFEVNHVGILFSEKARERVKSIIVSVFPC